MSFWESDLGEITGNEKEAFAKMFMQIPNNTKAVAKIDSFTTVDYKGFKYLLVEWLLMDGEFKGQKVQQKLKVFGGDSYDKDSEKTRYRSLNMFKLLYQLFDIKPKHSGIPSDIDLQIFIGKIAGIKIGETTPNENGKQYNWVSEVHDPKGFECETGERVVISSTFIHKNKPIQSEYDDGIPF